MTAIDHCQTNLVEFDIVDVVLEFVLVWHILDCFLDADTFVQGGSSRRSTQRLFPDGQDFCFASVFGMTVDVDFTARGDVFEQDRVGW